MKIIFKKNIYEVSIDHDLYTLQRMWHNLHTCVCVYIYTCEYKSAMQLGCIKKPSMVGDNYKDPFAFMKSH